MPYLLRVIRRGRWLDKREPWYEQDDFGADCLADLITQDNAISVWSIKDDESNLEEVVVAVAASKDHLSNFDYAMFPESVVATVGVVKESLGDTPVEAVNNRWHRDLKELSGKRLLRLASGIRGQSERRRVGEKEVKNLLRDACQNDEGLLVKLKPGVRKELA